MATGKKRGQRRRIRSASVLAPAFESDHVRIIAAWATLAPPGDDFRGRRQELEDICTALLNDFDTDTIWQIWQVISLHVREEQIEQLVDRWKDQRQRNRELVKTSQALRTSLKHDLQAAIQLHHKAAFAKWYSREVRTDKDGVERIVGAARRPWQRFPDFYHLVLRVIDIDPAIQFLAADPFHKRGAGSPVKIRNKRLRAELRALGLSEDRINAILWAVSFIVHPRKPR